MHRFFISPKNIISDVVVISQPEYHHIVNVLRQKENSDIVLFDGKGKEYFGRIEDINRDLKSVRVVIEKVQKEKVARPFILIQALIKSGNMDFIIEKAVELGVTHIYPIITKNSIIKLDQESGNAKIEKWKRKIEEACKQCGRSWLPKIDKIWDLEEVLNVLGDVENKIMCVPRTNVKNLKEVHCKKGAVSVMIGPEGDFTDEEVKMAVSKGWTPAHLGKTILRAETAAVSALSVLSYKFGLWD